AAGAAGPPRRAGVSSARQTDAHSGCRQDRSHHRDRRSYARSETHERASATRPSRTARRQPVDLRTHAVEPRAGGSPGPDHGYVQDELSAQNRSRSMFPPDTRATTFPVPARPEAAAAIAQAAAPSTITRLRSAASLTARPASSSVTTSDPSS